MHDDIQHAYLGAEQDKLAAFVSICEADRILPLPPSGALSGVPFGVKDNIEVRNLATTANTPALLGNVAARDNSVVERLRRAGAHPMGKTQTHELALGVTTSAAAHPATQHPQDPTRSPGGSSGGSAAAVASGIVPFALGTDTGGSISIPAAWCGVYGLRPTTGRWPGGGVVPLSPTRDTVGVIAHSIAMLERVDIAVRGSSGPVDTPVPGWPPGIIRLAVPERGSARSGGLGVEVQLAWDEVLRQLEGDERVEILSVRVDELDRIERTCGQEIEFFEISRALSAYLEGCPGTVSFDELREAVARDDVRELLTEAQRFSSGNDAYQKALGHRSRLQAEYERLFAESAVAGLLFPTTPGTAPIVHGPGRSTDAEIFAAATKHLNPGSVAGQPVVTFPGPTSESELPIGLSVEGGRGGDRGLLATVSALSGVLGTSR